MTEVDKIKEIMQSFLANNEFIRMFDMEFMKFEPDEVIGRIPLKESMLNPYGTLHGGAIYTFADFVTGTLANLSGNYCMTVEGNLSYLNAVKDTEYVYGRATLIKDGAHLVVVRVSITDDNNKLLDEGKFTFYKTDKQIVEG